MNNDFQNIKNLIIDYLGRNRVSTTEVADCLGKRGALEGIIPCVQKNYQVGEIAWFYAYSESNWPLHEQIQDMPEGKIVFVDEYGCNNRAIFGELVSKYMILYRQSKAIIVNGKLRDAAALIRQGWPIWCKGYTPVGCFNKKPELDVDIIWKSKQKEKYDGSIAVCDDCGVVIIEKENITNEFLLKLKNIEEQEDIWFDRLDHFKENTFDIVCQKKYLSDEIYMSRYNNEQ